MRPEEPATRLARRPSGEGGLSRRSPYLTTLCTCEQLMAKKGLKTQAPQNFRRPDNCRSDVEVDKGSWVYWLPERWTQGIRTQVECRKQMRCHFTSQGELSPDAHTDVRACFLSHAASLPRRLETKKLLRCQYYGIAFFPPDARTDVRDFFLSRPPSFPRRLEKSLRQ